MICAAINRSNNRRSFAISHVELRDIVQRVPIVTI